MDMRLSITKKLNINSQQSVGDKGSNAPSQSPADFCVLMIIQFYE